MWILKNTYPWLSKAIINNLTNLNLTSPEQMKSNFQVPILWSRGRNPRKLLQFVHSQYFEALNFFSGVFLLFFYCFCHLWFFFPGAGVLLSCGFWIPRPQIQIKLNLCCMGWWKCTETDSLIFWISLQDCYSCTTDKLKTTYVATLLTMHCSDYSGNFLKSFNDMRKEEQLCDVTINVGGKAFRAHKTVLAACSSYFLVMFTSGFKVKSGLLPEGSLPLY